MTKEQLLQLITKWFGDDDQFGYFRDDGDGDCTIDGAYNLDELAEFLVNEIKK